MIGAIEFMKRWKTICDEHSNTCDLCPISHDCRGSMGLLKEENILSLIALVMHPKGGVDVAEVLHQTDKS